MRKSVAPLHVAERKGRPPDQTVIICVESGLS